MKTVILNGSREKKQQQHENYDATEWFLENIKIAILCGDAYI
jgi:hypothetical protein